MLHFCNISPNWYKKLSFWNIFHEMIITFSTHSNYLAFVVITLYYFIFSFFEIIWSKQILRVTFWLADDLPTCETVNIFESVCISSDIFIKETAIDFWKSNKRISESIMSGMNYYYISSAMNLSLRSQKIGRNLETTIFPPYLFSVRNYKII